MLLHEGGVQTGTYNGCTGISGPIVEIAQKLDPQIDALITGHTHQPYNCSINDPSGQPRKVVSAFSFGRIITEMNFDIDNRTHDVVRDSVTATNHIVDADRREGPGPAGHRVEVDARGRTSRATSRSARSPRTSPGRACRRRARATTGARESSLSNLIADAQLESTAENGSQIAFMNAGGVRADLRFASRRAARATVS